MGVFATHQHRSIQMLNVLVGRSLRTWAPLRACMPSSYATTCLTHHNTRLLSTRQTVLLADAKSHKTFPSLALPLSHKNVLQFVKLQHKFKVDTNREIHSSLRLLFSSAEPTEEKLDSKPELESDFQEMIYHIPYMRGLYLVNKLKIYQTILTVTYVPLMFYLHSLNKITAFTVVGQTCITLFGLVMLYYMSYYARHVAGIMYINKAEDHLKIAHMSFWGKRQTEIVQIKDVIPFSEAGESLGERFKKIKLYSSDDQYYYIDLKKGHFVNKEKFQEVFGN